MSGEITSPKADRIFSDTKRLSDLRTGPASERQQDRACPVRFPTVAGRRQYLQSRALLSGRYHRRSARHASPRESILEWKRIVERSVGQAIGFCLVILSLGGQQLDTRT